jgi:hypothetical protein
MIEQVPFGTKDFAENPEPRVREVQRRGPLIPLALQATNQWARVNAGRT